MAENPCCAALRAKCKKLEGNRHALREGCRILQDRVASLETDNVRLKKAYDEEHARADHEREIKEKETAMKISAESKVVKMESQLSSLPLQQAGSPQLENLERELMILQGTVSEREAEIDRFKQLLEEETRKTNVERENAKVERQKAMELNEALEAQKNKAKEICACNLAEAKTVDDSESNKETLLEYKVIADENLRKFTEERSFANNLLKKLEEETVKVDLLKKEVLALKSFRQSAEAGFARQLSEKEVELKHLRDLLEVDKSRADAEQKKTAALQETLELEKMKNLKSSNMAQAESKKAKESLLKMEKLKDDVSKLTKEQSKREDMTNMYEAEMKNVLRERQRADAEKVKAVELKKLAEENEKRVMQEKSISERLSKQVEEERQKVDTLQKQVQELLLRGKSTVSAHPDNSELKEAYSKLETEHRRLQKENKHMERVKGQELKRIAEENDKKVMEERSNSKQLAQQMEAERQTIKMLQKQVQELLSSAKSTASDHSNYLKLKEAYSKLEDQNRMLIRERKRIEAEMMGKLDDLRKRSETNEKRYLEEKCRADRSSHDLETGKQKFKELEKELHSLKFSRKLVGNSTLPTVPDVNISSPILLHEKLKLEKKRLKHAKQVVKLEKYRNDVLQRELGKLKQDFVRTVQHLDMLEKTLCGGAHAVDNSTKSTDLSKLQSLYLNKMLLGSSSNLFGTLEDGLVVPGSSARCASDSNVPTVYSQPGNSTESPSGITNILLPLVGDGLREISPSSAMASSAASFHDKQLLGSQLQVAGSLAKSTIMVDEYTNPQATISKHSDQAGKRKYRAHAAAVVDNSSGTPLDSLCPHSRKRRKLLHEFESLKYMQIESRTLHDKLEKKLSKMNSKLNRLTPGQMEDAGCLLPDRVAAQHDGPRKKRKASHKLEKTLDHSHSLAKQIEGDFLLAPAPFPAIKERGSTQPCVDHISDPDTLLVFEQQIQGNVMKLLELDNEADEELFQTAMENPLSPTLPKFNCENSGLIGINPSGCGVDGSSHRSLLIGKDIVIFDALDAETNSKYKSYDPGSCSIDLGINNHVDMEINKENGIGFDQVGYETMISSAPISISDCAEQTDSYQLGKTVETSPLFCILFSFMEDTNRISMMLFATRRCFTKCCVHSQTERILMELLTALASEQQLTPREKVCVFFSVTMYNFLQVSSNESEVYCNQGSLCTFPLDLCSVLSDVKNRSNLAELFCFSELFCLFEDFVCQRRIIFCGDKDSEANNFTSRFDILLEGKKVSLYEKTASTHQVFAGSLIFSSICLAVGQISILWDVSFKVLQVWPADTQLILYILHGFAFVCGEKYVLTSNYRVQMEVVKSMVNVLENSHDKVRGVTLSKSDSKTCHRFPACARCPFAKSLQPLDILSMLVEELRKYASMPVDGVDSSSSLSIPDYAPNRDIYGYIDIMSSVELISVIMGWSWTTDKVFPELQKLLPLSMKGNFSTSLVLLLGRIGRFGVKSCGYEDAGVESFKQYLSSLFGKISVSEHNHKVASALFLALDGISQHNQKGPQNKLDCPTGLSAASTSIRKCYSSLSSEQKGLSSALNHFLMSK